MRQVLFLIMTLLPLVTVAEKCEVVESVCTAPNETRTIAGQPVFRPCWAYEDTYRCTSDEQLSDCGRLRDQGCFQVGSLCVDKTPDGYCTMYEQTYHCPDQPEKITETTVCESRFCNDSGACFDTSYPADTDFGQTVAQMEAVRQAGVYGFDPNSTELFKGYSEECTDKVLGGSTLKSCCGRSSGGEKYLNYAMMGAGMAADPKAREAVVAGSKYVYDSLFNTVDGSLVNKGVSALNSWAGSLTDVTSMQPNFGMYGFSFSFSFTTGFQFVGFDPYSFAFSVAMQVVQTWLQCESSDQVLMLKRGQNLCVHVDTECTKKIAGACIEKTQTHCCFNSKLAKIINRQGRAQLGMPMDQCNGFSQEQFTSIDFSKVDLAEFIADIVPKNIDPNNLANSVNQTVQDKVKNYYE